MIIIRKTYFSRTTISVIKTTINMDPAMGVCQSLLLTFNIDEQKWQTEASQTQFMKNRKLKQSFDDRTFQLRLMYALFLKRHWITGMDCITDYESNSLKKFRNFRQRIRSEMTSWVIYQDDHLPWLWLPNIWANVFHNL